jgi:hypothetical protein
MLILEDLYVGEVRPGERSGKRNRQYTKALDKAIKSGDALTASLTGQQKELFEAYMAAQREVNILTDVETYIYSFRLGAKIMMDVLTDGQIREI